MWMCAFSNAIREKPNWWEKIMDPALVEIDLFQRSAACSKSCTGTRPSETLTLGSRWGFIRSFSFLSIDVVLLGRTLRTHLGV